MLVNRFKKISILSVIIILITALCACSLNFDIDSPQQISKNEGELKVHYLDVGQGDSIFIELPNSQSMLIDAGVSSEGESIQQYINDSGYQNIDYLIATHPHADHIGSMDYIVSNMDIGSIYMPKVSTNTKTFERLLQAISDKGYKVNSAYAGMTILNEDDLLIKVLAPAEIDPDSLNDCSIVMMITYNNNKFLFTGDAEKAELNTITDDISADVLKVGHHGSKTSTTKAFLQAVNPQYAVISCGKDNDYKHPHKSTVKLLEKQGVTYFRTDLQGTIVITSDGNKISVDTNATSIERN